MDIHVLQGERPMAADNMSLGRFRLDGIPAAPRGTPQIEVTFDIDANGIINVFAKDKATGREQKVTITASTNLNKADIERLVQEAQKNKDSDLRLRELVEARNLADSVAYQAEKLLKEKNGTTPGELRTQLESKIKALRQSMTGEDLAGIRRQTEELEKLAGQLAQAGQPNPGPDQGPTSEPSGEPMAANGPDVVDGEFHQA